MIYCQSYIDLSRNTMKTSWVYLAVWVASVFLVSMITMVSYVNIACLNYSDGDVKERVSLIFADPFQLDTWTMRKF